MSKPNFFCDFEALNCLIGMDFEDGYKDIDLTVDLIELPIFLLFTSDEENWTVKAMQRGEIYRHDDSGIERGKVVINKESGEGEVSANQKNIADLLGPLFHACQNLSCFIQDKGLEQVYADFDPEDEGILLYVEDEELKYKAVSGKERPDMMCATLFGGSSMGRPYMDEFMERSFREEMSLDEKIDAAENGDIHCMNELAVLYLDGDDETDPDPEEAVYWFRKLAEAGESNGMFSLALHYAKGFGVERDFEKAAYWMGEAAKAGDTDAPRSEEKYRKMAASLQKAEAGDAEAQAILARGFMELGNSLSQAGPGKDYEESVKWAKRAVDQGNGDAMWTLALAYQHGRGVDEDMDTAIEYYTKGAEIENAACMHSLGCEYMNGQNIKKDKKKGFELFKAAAEQGYGLAMRDLGFCYQFAKGCTGNMKTALEWYEKALEVLNDSELAQRVEIFKQLSTLDEHWGEDYEEDPDDDEEDVDIDEEDDDDDAEDDAIDEEKD